MKLVLLNTNARLQFQITRKIAWKYISNKKNARRYPFRSNGLHTVKASPLISTKRLTNWTRISNKQCTEQANLRDDGIFDERNLLKFETLYELQRNASTAFAQNALFGTYKERKGMNSIYNWMTYGEYGVKVNQCRTVLKEIGTSS